jgi:hypothetical protein
MGDYADVFSHNLNPEHISNDPLVFSYTFAFTSDYTGKFIRFKLQASNEMGSAMSFDFLSVLLARIPNAPSQ